MVQKVSWLRPISFSRHQQVLIDIFAYLSLYRTNLWWVVIGAFSTHDSKSCNPISVVKSSANWNRLRRFPLWSERTVDRLGSWNLVWSPCPRPLLVPPNHGEEKCIFRAYPVLCFLLQIQVGHWCLPIFDARLRTLSGTGFQQRKHVVRCVVRKTGAQWIKRLSRSPAVSPVIRFDFHPLHSKYFPGVLTRSQI